MTDHLPPLTDDDLSAHLDGVADAEVAARIAADPAASERLAALRAASEAVAAPVAPLAPSTVDDLIARALAAAGTEATTDPSAPGAPAAPADPTVVPLAPPRRTGGRGAPRWLVAAAVVVAVAIGVGLIWSGQRSTGDEDVAAPSAEQTVNRESADDAGGGTGGDSSASDDAGDASENLDSAEPAPGLASPHDAPATTAPDGETGDPDSTTSASEGSAYAATLPFLGAFDDADELRAAVGTAFPTATATPSGADVAVPDAADVDRCAEQLVQTLSNDYTLTEPATDVGLVTVAGEPVIVYEFAIEGDGDGAPIAGASALVLAVGPTACNQVAFIQR